MLEKHKKYAANTNLKVTEIVNTLQNICSAVISCALTSPDMGTVQLCVTGFIEKVKYSHKREFWSYFSEHSNLNHQNWALKQRKYKRGNVTRTGLRKKEIDACWESICSITH